MVWCLKVEKTSAQKYRQLLLANQWLNNGFVIGHEGEFVLLPLQPGALGPLRAKKLGELVEAVLPERPDSPRSLYDALRGELSEEEAQALVTSFDIVGDVAILEIPPRLADRRFEIAKALMRLHPRIRVVAKKAEGTGGPFRIRPVEVIAGEPRTRTICVENGCRLAVDLNRAYYTPRWSAERLRIARLIRPGENVLVLFAGIGPYPVCFEKHSKPASIAAIELNPDAVALMRENVSLNRCKRIEVVEGDAAQVLSKRRWPEWAHRLLMPHPSESMRFLPAALPALRPGGFLHLYAFAPASDPFLSALKAAQAIANDAGFSLRLLNSRIVRPYSPTLVQVVLDLEVNQKKSVKGLPPSKIASRAKKGKR